MVCLCYRLPSSVHRSWQALRFCGFESESLCQHDKPRESKESMQLILAQEIINPRPIDPLRKILEAGGKRSRFFNADFF